MKRVFTKFGATRGQVPTFRQLFSLFITVEAILVMFALTEQTEF
jgi:hypothetical protein